MHDPLTVAFEIRRPWPTRSSCSPLGAEAARWRIRFSAFWRVAGRDYYWPPLVTIWHREPRGRDGLTACSKRVQRRDGTWRRTRGWRLHLHHWKIQVPPLQQLRRRLLTRCAWCGGRSAQGDQVNISHQWGGPRGRWWTGERGLYHRECSSIQSAHDTCVCERPVLEHGTYGRCARCQKHRDFGITVERLARARELAAVPHGERIAA